MNRQVVAVFGLFLAVFVMAPAPIVQAKQPTEWKAKVTVKNLAGQPVTIVLDGRPAFFLTAVIPAGGKTQFVNLLEGVSYTAGLDLNADGVADGSTTNYTSIRGNTTILVTP